MKQVDPAVGVYALRTFLIRNDWLVSLSGKHCWKNGTCVAECSRGHDHEAPHENCTCGVYGKLSMPALLREYEQPASRIVAVIAAQGKTFVGDLGLKTAVGQVVAYWADDERHRRACLRQFMARGFPDLGDMLAAYGFPPEQTMPQSRIIAPARSVPVPPGRASATHWWRQLIDGYREDYDDNTPGQLTLTWTDRDCTDSGETLAPYGVHIGARNGKSQDIISWGGSIIRTLPRSSLSLYLDLLWHEQPTSGRWTYLTDPGNHIHPNGREDYVTLHKVVGRRTRFIIY